MQSHHAHPRRVAGAPILAAVLALAACSSTPASTSASSPAQPDRGPVDVLYAGSLVNLMEDHVAPGLQAATGYRFSGYPGGSKELAQEIAGRVRQADVFLSASPAADTILMGAANGDHVRWYVTFATSALVLGYNPSSRFAHDLVTQPWYKVVTEPGFRLGRTDPALDPKGVLSVKALNEAASDEHMSALSALAEDQSEVFPEEALLGRLEAGQLDAAFLYTTESTQAHVPTVPLTPLALGATYTVTVPAGAPHVAGAEAFVAYLLGAPGVALLRAGGLSVPARMEFSGDPAAVPAGLKALSAGMKAKT